MTVADDRARAYAGRRVLVAGTGVAGAACAEVLLGLDARVTVLDRTESEALVRLRDAGARTVVGEAPDPDLLADLDDVIVSPGFAPHTPVARAARERGLPVYSEPELAWRLRGPEAAGWLAVTGTNGKTTTTTMLAAMLRAAGYRTGALGNIGEPLVHAVLRDDYEVLAVELSSFQLHWSQTLAPQGGALLNLADDHLEWHGDFEAYATAKLAIWRSATDGTGVAVGNLDDPAVAARLAGQPGRTVGVTVQAPGPGALGVVDGMLVDRAFGEPSGVELVAVERIRPAGRHNVSNALHAAALARSWGVPASAVRTALEGYEPQPHRNAHVATVAGVSYVDDSKATNPHAAFASLTAYPRVVWIAGGQLKGVDVNDLVAAVADRLVGAVLLGVDRGLVADALRRHAPAVPVVDVSRTDDEAMTEVVRAAAGLARAGDTVLLAPAAASKDMFTGYDQRGDRFAAAVSALAG